MKTAKNGRQKELRHHYGARNVT